MITESEAQKLRWKFLEYLRDDEKSSATELIVQYILKNYNIYSIKNDAKTEIYIYKDGIYVPQGASEIKCILRFILEKWYNQYYYGQILRKIEVDTFIEADKFFSSNNPKEIAVNNGILDIYSRELKPFTPEKIFFSKMPVDYAPDAKCPLIDKHFSEVLKNPEDKTVMYEIIGYCLESTHFIEKAFMFIGYGRNGKGKSLEIIKRLVGAESCCAVPLASMQPDSFNLWQIFGKKVNLAGDLSNTDLKETGLFKSLTGRDTITAHRKFMTDLIFMSTCKNIFACNELPKVYDLTKGFWSRWILLEFPYEFIKQSDYDSLSKPDKQFKKIIDTEHIQKICTSQELSGLLNQALNGLERLQKNKDFSYTIGSNAIKELWIRMANSFTAFCYDCILEDENGIIKKSDLRKYFNIYRARFKLKGAGDREIKATLEDLYAVGEARIGDGDKQEHVWTGIKYIEKEDKEDCGG